jgi:GT2 family glycosyltransferase
MQRGCLSYCLSLMEADPTIGVLSCRLLNADGSAQNVCRRFPSPARCLVGALSLPWKFPGLFGWGDCEDLSWDRNTIAKDVDWLGGAFLLARGDWVAKHGLLDERFFFYGEDIEFCFRVRSTGFRCHYDPKATVVHLGGSSSDPTRMAANTRNIHSWRGRYLVQRYCYGRLAEFFLKCVDLVNVWARVKLSARRGRRDTPEHKSLVEALGLLTQNWSKWSERAA